MKTDVSTRRAIGCPTAERQELQCKVRHTVQYRIQIKHMVHNANMKLSSGGYLWHGNGVYLKHCSTGNATN